MRCVSEVLGSVRQHGWAHHIQRLMVLGNLALTAGVDPWELTEWMWSSFVDGAEWVMLPNVVGMALHADGGRMATKPYASGGAYIDRMSDYCGDCRYDRKRRTGADACPFTTLYWDFLDRHRDRFLRNARVARQVRAADRLGDLDDVRERAGRGPRRAGPGDAVNADGPNAGRTADRPCVVVLGAGISGLVAARELAAQHDVVVLDKGRGVGGRTATRRLRDAAGPPAVVDHGAPFVQDDPALDELVAELAAADVLRPGPPDAAGRRQWRARPGMTAIAKHLAAGLDVRLDRRVTWLGHDGSTWSLHVVHEPDGGEPEVVTADAVLATAPVPQLLQLADSSQLELDAAARATLAAVRYDPALMVIAGLDASQLVGADGLLRPAEGPVGLVVDHCVTGTSSVPAVTVRARPATSQAWFDRSDDAVVAELLGAVGLVADAATQVQVRRWRYARSAVRAAADHVVAVADPVLVVAGDAFGGAAAAVLDGQPGAGE